MGRWRRGSLGGGGSLGDSGIKKKEKESSYTSHQKKKLSLRSNLTLHRLKTGKHAKLNLKKEGFQGALIMKLGGGKGKRQGANSSRPRWENWGEKFTQSSYLQSIRGETRKISSNYLWIRRFQIIIS